MSDLTDPLVYRYSYTVDTRNKLVTALEACQAAFLHPVTKPALTDEAIEAVDDAIKAMDWEDERFSRANRAAEEAERGDG